MRSSPDMRNGVTLIEMLVAIALLGIVMSAAYRALHTGSRVARNQQEMMMSTSQGWELLDQMSTELRSIPADMIRSGTFLRGDIHREDIERIGANSSGNEFGFPPQAGVPAANVRFCTLADQGPSGDDSSPQMVQYEIQYHPAPGMESGLYRRAVSPDNTLESADWKLENPRVCAMKIQYRTGNSDWRESWSRNFLPDVVRITLWLRASPPGQKLQLQRFTTSVGLPSGNHKDQEVVR